MGKSEVRDEGTRVLGGRRGVSRETKVGLELARCLSWGVEGPLTGKLPRISQNTVSDYVI